MGTNDNKLAIFNALHTLDIASNESYAATMQHDGESVWDKGGAFAIVRSFKTSRDDYLNSLNSSSTCAPPELSISLKKPFVLNTLSSLTTRSTSLRVGKLLLLTVL
jgi:hypothetical protein